MSQQWKHLERQCAKTFHGERRKRGGDFSQSMPDVTAPPGVFRSALIIECKYSKYQPWVDIFSKADTDICVALDGEDQSSHLIFWELSDSEQLAARLRNWRGETFLEITKKVPGYLREHLAQAESYCKEDIIPIVVIGKRYGKRVAYTSLKYADYI